MCLSNATCTATPRRSLPPPLCRTWLTSYKNEPKEAAKSKRHQTPHHTTPHRPPTNQTNKVFRPKREEKHKHKGVGGRLGGKGMQLSYTYSYSYSPKLFIKVM
jgi:hypothetical protein